MQKFCGLIERRRELGLMFVLNPAFWEGLEVTDRNW
jgi:hypothetical protein